MDNNDNFALVTRSSGALEKAEPGVKRILFGMVADTLALAKKEQATRPSFTILVGSGSALITELLILAGLGQRYDLRFIHCCDATGLLRLARDESFDVIVIFLDDVDWSTLGNAYHEGRIIKAIELLGGLKARHGKPIIVLSNWRPQTFDLPTRLEQAEIDLFFSLPFEQEGQELVDALDVCRKAQVTQHEP